MPMVVEERLVPFLSVEYKQLCFVGILNCKSALMSFQLASLFLTCQASTNYLQSDILLRGYPRIVIHGFHCYLE
jgi:hypothetical protein